MRQKTKARKPTNRPFQLPGYVTPLLELAGAICNLVLALLGCK
jgi:hypothetical protein